ncbi:MAG: hypothetical protein WCP39_02300, partial [Chlamydiota bacterium]
GRKEEGDRIYRISVALSRLKQNMPPLSAFFRYKTYSDFLQDLLGPEYFVINAGVPAHTSLQGSRRLLLLLNRFKEERIPINWITAYFGNNDSVWDHNRQDKEWVGKKKRNILVHQFFNHFKKNDDSIITRVSATDYKENMKAIIRTCQNYGIDVSIIEPLAPIYWKPGTRVQNEKLERKNYSGSIPVYKLLDEALVLWNQASKQTSYSELKKVILEATREKDYVVPRIKKGHLQSLRNLANESELSYVYINLDRSVDDIRYFIDYCHPIGQANLLIAEKILEIISGKCSGKESNWSLVQKDEIQTTQLNKKFAVNLDLPTATYTLY